MRRAPAAPDERAAAQAAPGARVLLAEDNPINALLARSLLEREGLPTRWTGSATGMRRWPHGRRRAGLTT